MFYPLLDHDDLQKSRKALMTTALFIILISHLELTGEAFTIASLSVKINKQQIVEYAGLFLAYFYLIYGIRFGEVLMAKRVERGELNLTEVQKRVERQIEEMKESVENLHVSVSAPDATRTREFNEKLDYIAAKLVTRPTQMLRTWRAMTLMVIDGAIPTAVALWAITYLKMGQSLASIIGY